jgi:signal transduction histidine kinase
LRCDHAGFYQRAADTRLLQLITALGQPLPEEESSLEAGPVGRSDAWGSPLRVTVGGEEDPKLQEVMHESGMESVMCAPVLRNEHSHSVLLAGRERGEAVFSEADYELFVMIARQAAIALENAHLYAELRDYLRQVEESQRALIQAEKMAAIGRLTASIAHEINNPLQAMRNCLHLVGREELPLEKRNTYLQMAESELERLMQTVGQMLDFYRPSALQRELCDVRALIERVLKLLRKQMKKGRVEVHTDFAQELPQVFVVSNQIQQVFFNILLNAMEAMGEGGEIFIEARPCPEGVEVIFEDTGPGLGSEVRSHLFEPFTSTKEKGTGLGLSVSYNILETHGGKLEFLDGRGRGACFRVVLPRMEA